MKIPKGKSFNNRLLFILVFSLFFLPQIFPEAPAVVDPGVFIPDSDAVSASSDAGMDDREFIYYAFRFSGVKKDLTGKYLEKYDSLASGFDRYLESRSLSTSDYYMTGEAILFFLHDNLFRRYAEMETRLDILFDKGIFNCVSSGIIYFALASRSGLDVRAVRTSDHAFCALSVEGETVDVETTTRHGFDPGEKKEFRNSFGETGFIYTPPANYSDRRDIGKIEMLSLILQNRISEMQHRGNYLETVPLAVDRHALLGTPESFREMMTEFKNHAVQLSSKNDYSKALDFLTAASSAYEPDPVISDAAGKLFYNQIVLFLEKNRAQEAADFHKSYESLPLIDSSIREDTLKMINEKKLYLFVIDNGFSVSHEQIIRYHEENLINSDERQEYVVFIYSREIQRLSVDKGWIEALDAAGKGRRETSDDPRIIKLEETVKHNIGILYHNRFASLYNSGEREKALAVVEEGLGIVPDSATLLSDLDYIREN